MTTVFASAISKKKKWLDLCAGPGGKAALLSSIAKENGVEFTANELSTPRAQLVKQVVVGARVWACDGREVSTHGETFDAILIDAPCTGLGALRRRPEVRWRRSVQDLRELTQLQRELLDGAYEVLESEGVLAYATCSPHLAETQVQVMDLLKRHPDLEQIPIDDLMPMNLEGATRSGSMTLWTHIHGTDAMFLALFRKRVTRNSRIVL